ncbi:unnamed protein product, partial [Heligmosomoides polygyrus]|uniref:CCHC-type domain-containing protein n=1 Tax=Heligmosomoides polygyrus TaxID=6339 RepID=A0A183G7A5_HELPZ
MIQTTLLLKNYPPCNIANRSVQNPFKKMQSLQKLRRELFEKTRKAKQLRQELVETRQELDGVRQELLKKHWMAAPQLNDEGKPLLMDPHLLDSVIADQLMLLDDHRSTLNDLRCLILAESNQESSTFQEQVKTALVNMQSSLDAALQALAQRPQPPADKPVHNPLPEPDDNAPAHEDIPVHQQEGEVIHDNLEFMEQIDEDLDPQPEYKEPEHQVNDNVEPMEHIDGVEAEPQPNAPIRQQIEQELQQLRQAQNDFHLMIEELRNPSAHQEDVRLARKRRSIIENRKRCLECLEYCRGGKQCPKYYARCYYCGSYEHHSALC